MQCAASEEEEEEQDKDEDYSFSLSGFLEEDAFVDPAMLSRALEDSISFTFSTENLLETKDCGSFDFAPLLKYVHACTLESSPVHSNFARLQNDGDHENGALVPFKISGSWRADSSFRHSSMHSESRRSFSFPTDMENDGGLEEESLIHLKDATSAQDLAIDSEGEDHVINMSDSNSGDDEGMQHHYKGYSECDDDWEVPDKHADDKHHDGKVKHADDERHDDKVNNVLTCLQSINTARDCADLFHYDDNQHSENEMLLPAQSNAESQLRFAGEGLLQPWSSSKLSKSVKRQLNAERRKSQGITHFATHDSTNILSHLHPLAYNPSHKIKDDFHRNQGMRPSSHMRSSESVLFSPSVMREVVSPPHAPICMPRKSSSLFARRTMRSTSESSSLIVHAQKPPVGSTFLAEGLPSPSSNKSASPSSNKSAYSSSYRTSSNGSTQSSGYSSSSGKCSTPSSSRNSSRNTLHVAAARCSLQQRMDAEPFKLCDQKAKPHPSAQFHTKGDSRHKEGSAYMPEADQSKVKTDPFAAGHAVMSPSTSSPSPRSPLSWRSVLSLQPLNPSHVPQDQWEILGKRSSSCHSQRSRSSSRGSSGKDGRTKTPSMSAATFKELLLTHSNTSTTSSKGGTQKLVKTRRGYNWALNPMKWFKHCRNEAQVVNTTTTIEERPPHKLIRSCP